MNIGLVQVNPTVGDLDGNAAKILRFTEEAARQGAELVVFPSGALTGAPLAGLGRSSAFAADAAVHLERLAHELPVLALVSCVIETAAFPYGDNGPSYAEAESATGFTNALFILGDDEVQLLYAPEFEPEGSVPIVQVGDSMLAVILDGHFNTGLKLEGANVLVEMNADIYTQEYAAPAALGTLSRFMTICKACQAFMVYANLCGAADTTVFAGNSLVFAPRPRLLYAAELDKEEICVFSTADRNGTRGAAGAAKRDGQDIIWRGIVTATRDYVRKNGFSDVVVGVSGGIDSALVATAATDALGAQHVHAVLMPGPYSSEGSITDAEALVANLGIDAVTVPIDGPLESLHAVLGEPCGGAVDGVAAENLQARIRAVYLMTISNAKGWLVLNTGNKSEAAMGFSTLGGDTAGVYAPIGQVYKTDCYALAAWRAEQGPSIPQACIDKPPSAELYPGATDQDRLPPYDKLDAVLLDHVDGGMSAAQCVEQGQGPGLVNNVLTSLQKAEFKRRLEPMGPRVMGLSLTDDRAWPVTNAWRDASADGR